MQPNASESDYNYEIGYTYDAKVLPEHRKHTGYSGISYLSWYIQAGQLQLEAFGKSFHAGPGEWVFIDPLTVKSHHFSEDAHLISIRFRINWNNLNFIPPLTAPRVHREQKPEKLLSAAKAFSAFEMQNAKAIHKALPSIRSERKALFYTWLQQWNRVRELDGDVYDVPMDPRVYAILSALGSETNAKPVDYKTLSKAVGLSRAQINRIFKQATTLTPKQWKDAQCLKQAEDWLRDGKLSIKEIAGRLDFFDASHFTKWFRTKMSVAPSDWSEH